MIMKRKMLFFNVLIIHLYALGIIYLAPEKDPVKKAGGYVVIASTTNPQDPVLLDTIFSQFEKRTGSKVKILSVRSDKAIDMGMNGEADIILVHSPADEKVFMEQGYGIERVPFISNELVLLGPGNDPANINKCECPLEAFSEIADKKAVFISCGDGSGTQKKEISLWEEAGVFPVNETYIETGKGMAETIYIANKKNGYCLADLVTYLKYKKTLGIGILNRGDPRLINQYNLILVNPEKVPGVNARGARELMEFILSTETKSTMENYDREISGQLSFNWENK